PGRIIQLRVVRGRGVDEEREVRAALDVAAAAHLDGGDVPHGDGADEAVERIPEGGEGLLVRARGEGQVQLELLARARLLLEAQGGAALTERELGVEDAEARTLAGRVRILELGQGEGGVEDRGLLRRALEVDGRGAPVLEGDGDAVDGD